MHAHSPLLRTLLVALAASAASLAVADSADLHRGSQHGIEYVTGGVGTEQKDLREAGQDYPLKLMFAEQATGAYVADVHVVVAERSGRTVLDVTSDGPALFARVPPGEYRVTAEYRGMRETRTIRAGSGSAVTMHFTPEPGSAALPASVRVPHENDGIAPSRGGAETPRGR